MLARRKVFRSAVLSLAAMRTLGLFSLSYFATPCEAFWERVLALDIPCGWVSCHLVPYYLARFFVLGVTLEVVWVLLALLVRSRSALTIWFAGSFR